MDNKKQLAYELLNIPKDSPIEEIKKAYKNLALKNHPDKKGSATIMKMINNAYFALTNEHGEF